MLTNSQKIYDVIIIGGGPVGMWTAYMAKMLGLSVILIEAMNYLGGQCISHYPEKCIFDIPGIPQIRADELIKQLKVQMDMLNTEFSLNTFVEKITQVNDKLLIHTKNHTMESKSLIFSVGLGINKPNKPDWPNLDSLGDKCVYVFSNPEQFKDKICIIAGGGDSAADWAVQLSPIAKEVHIIHRRATLKAMNSLQDQIRQLPIHLHLEHNIETVDLVENILHIKTQYAIIKGDYIIPCYGMKIDNNQIAVNIVRDRRHKIIVDPTTCTSSNHLICAVSDAATYDNKYNLLSTGFSDGTKAVHYIKKTLHQHIPIGHSTDWFANRN